MTWVDPAMTKSSSLHSQLSAIMETMALSALSQISQLVDEDSVKLRFELSEALLTNSALSEKVKRLECELASRPSSRTVGVQTDASAAPTWKDEDPHYPDTVTDLPHTSEKSTDTLSHPFTVTEFKSEDSVLIAAINSNQGLIGTEEPGESASMESEPLQLPGDSDCNLSFDCKGEPFHSVAAKERPSMQLIQNDCEEAFSSHVIPIEEDDDDDDDDYAQFIQGSQQELPMNVAAGGPSIGKPRTASPNKAADGASHKFTCKICRRTFFYKRTLTRHMKLHMSNYCKICKQRFPRGTKLKPHVCVAKVPQMSTAWACNLCGKVFCNQSALGLHNLVHTGERPHSCSFCGKTFTQKGNLKCHLRIHTGERPFHCSICGKTFVHKNRLNSHLLSHRQGKTNGSKPAASS